MSNRTSCILCAVLATFIIPGCDKMPDGAEVLPGKFVDQMLQQCSRDAPEKGEGTWSPTAADIRRFERQAAVEIPKQLPSVDWSEAAERKILSEFPDAFERQYVGIVRKGRKYIYGTFGPKEAFANLPRPRSPTERVDRVCDGGPVFFGAEQDVDAKRFTHWAFNGSVG